MDENNNFGFLNQQDDFKKPVEEQCVEDLNDKQNTSDGYNEIANQELNANTGFSETTEKTVIDQQTEITDMQVDTQVIQPDMYVDRQAAVQGKIDNLSAETRMQFEQYYDYRRQQEKIQENTNKAKKQRKRSGGLIISFTAIGIACIVIGGIIGVLASPDSANSILDNIKQIEKNPESILAPERSAWPAETPVLGGNSYNIVPGDEKIADICDLMTKSVVGVKGYVLQSERENSSKSVASSYGSGLIISKDGYILSNSHVVEGCDSFDIILYDDTVLSAVLVGNDTISDISVLKVKGTNLNAAPLGDSDKLRVGEQVIAIGNPLGEELSNSVTVGYVSGLRKIVFNEENQRMIQTDAAINSGNSGGPLVNLKGEVIGINTLKKIYSGVDDYGMPISTEGLGFAIPMSVAKSMAEKIIAGVPIERPGIGVIITDVTEEEMAELKMPQGVLVVEVTQGGPASVGGILADDVITEINGNKIKDFLELKDELKKCKIGDEISITIWRQGQVLKKSAVVGDLSKMR